MLNEIKDVRQIKGEGLRRWFTSAYFDLIVWFDKRGSVDGFQLTYDKPTQERAITWRAGRGFVHEKVDDGERPGQAKMAPILVPDGIFDVQGVTDRFRAESAEMDPEIAALVLETLSRFPEGE